MPQDAASLAREVAERARTAGVTVATAESCTGGLVAAALTDVAGISEVFAGGVVAYSNALKTAALGVPAEVIESHGAVSAETAAAMAEGARLVAGASVAVSVTGVAGPGGGTAEKPVGLVWFGLATAEGVRTHVERYGDLGRDGVRSAGVVTALILLRDAVG